MNIDNISSINCIKRNKYDKKFCNNLNPDKINDLEDPFEIFDKNIFSLENKNNTIKDISSKECMEHCIYNKNEGFTYQGNKNKCFLFNSSDLNEKISEDYNNYNIKSFIKTKDIIDIDTFEDQINSNNHFKEANNYNFMYNGLINNVDAIDKNKCMDLCVREYDNCKSIMYMEQPKECTFYKNKVMNNQNIDLKNNDVYTVKNKKLKELDDLNQLTEDDLSNKYYCYLKNNNCELDYKVSTSNNIQNTNEIKSNDNIPLFNCSGLYSTNPFCTKEYNPDDTEYIKNTELSKLMNYTDCVNISKIDNIHKQEKIFNNVCRKKYGNEYIFDNNVFDTESILKCEEGGIKAKCKLSLDDKNLIIENFTNKNTNSNENTNISFIIIIFITLIIVFIIIIIFFITIITLLNN